MKYGNFNLCRGDHDGKPQENLPPRWAGVDNPSTQPISAQTETISSTNSGASLTISEHVRALQEDLRTLGFSVVGAPDGSFGKSCEWAVREFQIYAKMAQVAEIKESKRGQLLLSASGAPHLVENNEIYYDSSAVLLAKAGQAPSATGSTIGPVTYYIDALESTNNTQPYGGPISGVVNTQTRSAIEFWLENYYRCPVVVEAWNTDNAGTRTSLTPNGVNLWKHDSLTSAAPRIFVLDFSSYYSHPITRPITQYHAIGYYEPQGFGGPSAAKKHSWSPEAEMTVENITGAPVNPAQLNTSTLSTYRTIRVVAEAECFGRFDVLNAWDNALISAGPCHWTMGISSGAEYSKGELPGFISYLHHHDEITFKQAFGNFGLDSIYSWTDPRLYVSDTRTYMSWVKLENDTYTPSQPTHTDTEFTDLAESKVEAHYLKSWHWFYRLSMAGRTLPAYQQAMWGMAKVRIQKILAKQITFQVGTVAVNTTLGQLYTSERSVAILLRWHVYRPAHVVHPTLHRIAPAIQASINNNATLNWLTPVANWGNAHEAALVESLLSAANAVNTTVTNTINFGATQSQGAVRSERNSFTMDV